MKMVILKWLRGSNEPLWKNCEVLFLYEAQLFSPLIGPGRDFLAV